jgi:hypothetical protein
VRAMPPVPFLNPYAETVRSEISAVAVYKVNRPALLIFIQWSPSFKTVSYVKPYQSCHLTVPLTSAPCSSKYQESTMLQLTQQWALWTMMTFLIR